MENTFHLTWTLTQIFRQVSEFPSVYVSLRPIFLLQHDSESALVIRPIFLSFVLYQKTVKLNHTILHQWSKLNSHSSQKFKNTLTKLRECREFVFNSNFIELAIFCDKDYFHSSIWWDTEIRYQLRPWQTNLWKKETSKTLKTAKRNPREDLQSEKKLFTYLITKTQR